MMQRNLPDAANQVFPSILHGFKKKCALGGSTNSVFSIINEATQQEFVLKSGAHADAAKIEMLCNITYRALGVNVPEMRVYRDLPAELAEELGLSSCEGRYQVSAKIAAHHSQSETLISAAARQDFAAHVLLGNIDVAKTDNFILDQQGKVYLIDAGANFLFRAKGCVRRENKAIASEIDSLRDAEINESAHEWFASLTDDDIAAQVKAIAAKHAAIETAVWEASAHLALPEELRHQFLEYLSDRLDQLVVRFCRNSQTVAKSDKKADSNQTAAGILTCTLIEGVPHLLLSKRVRHEWWDNFGGKSEAGDVYLIDTARREVTEESSAALHYSTSTLHASPFHDIVTGPASQPFIYRMYISPHQLIDLKCLVEAEHTLHQYLPLSAVLVALGSKQRVTLEGKETVVVQHQNQDFPLFPPLLQMLQQPPVYNNLQQFMHTHKLLTTHTLGFAEASNQPAIVSYRPLVTPGKKRQQIAATQQHKSALLREIKRQHSATVCPAATVDSNHLSQSEIHLQAILGKDYCAGELEKNVRCFVDKYYAGNERLVRECVTLIANEKSGGTDQIYFYHACNNEVAFIYDVYTALYQALQADDQWAVFRLDSEHFKRFTNVTEFMDFYSERGTKEINNNEKYYNDCALSANVFLFGNHEVPTSNSINYLIDNDVRRSVDLTALFSNILRPFHFSAVDIQQLLQVFTRSAQAFGGTLYQISMSRADANQMAYPAGSMGKSKLLDNERDFATIFKTLQTSDLQDPATVKYISKLQARVMVPPHLSMQVKTVKWGNTPANVHAAYQQHLQQCVRNIFEMIMRNFSAYHHNDRRAAMVRQLPAILAANQLSLSAVINETVVARAILANDAETVRNMLTAYPEFKTKTLVIPQEYIESESEQPRRAGSMTPLQMILVHSKLTYADILACFGDTWLESLEAITIKDNVELAGVIKKLPGNKRLEFLNHPRVHFDKNIALKCVLELLDIQDRLAFANHHSNHILSARGLRKVLVNLPDDVRFAFAIRHEHLLITGYDLWEALEGIPDADRLVFATRYQHIIQHENDLVYVLDRLPLAQRFAFVNDLPNSDVIIVGNRLARLTEMLPLQDRWAFASRFIDKLAGSCTDSLGSVLKTLRVDDRMRFAVLHVDLIKSAKHLAVVVSALSIASPADALQVACKYEEKIENWKQLASVLEHIAITERLAFAQRLQSRLALTAGLNEVISCLPRTDQVAFATANATSIHDTRELLQVLRSFLPPERCAFALQHLALIGTIDDVMIILSNIPYENSQEFIANCKNHMHHAADLAKIIQFHAEEDQLDLVRQYQDLLQSGDDYCFILRWLAPKLRTPFALESSKHFNLCEYLPYIFNVIIPRCELMHFATAFLQTPAGHEAYLPIFMNLPEYHRYEFASIYLAELLLRMPIDAVLEQLHSSDRALLMATLMQRKPANNRFFAPSPTGEANPSIILSAPASPRSK